MSTHALIEKRLGKSLESVTKEELINLLQDIETEKKELKKQRKYDFDDRSQWELLKAQ